MTSFPFPHAELTKITGKPTAATIKQLKREVFANLREIHSDLGGGAHGYLGLGLPAGQYFIRAGTAFVAPAHPGALPTYAAGTTGPAITAGNRVYDANLTQFKTYMEVKNAVRKQIMEAVETRYYQELEDADMGYADVTILQLLQHFTTNYGTLTATELEANRAKLSEQWNPDSPFEDFWKNIQTICAVATAGQIPITDAPTIELSLQALAKAGVYTHAIETWHDKPDVEQTWANFITHFNHQEKQRIKKLTTRQAGLHHTRPDAAVPVTPDRNQSLAKAIAAELAYTTDTGAAHNNTTTTGASKLVCDSRELFYCWTHGLTANKNHTSDNCRNPAHGHNKKATLFQRKGGNDKIFCGRQGKPSE